MILKILLFSLLFTATTFGSIPSHLVRVGFFKFDGYHQKDSLGNQSGYGYEYLQQLSYFNDFIYEYVGYDKSWADMQEMLERGEIDLLSSAQKTPERLEKFSFSKYPIGVSSSILTVKEGNSNFQGKPFKNIKGIRVGLLTGNSRNKGFEHFASENNIEYTPVYYQNTDLMITDLQKNKIDVILTSTLRQVENEWIIAMFDPSPFYIMVKKGREDLLDSINTSLKYIEMYRQGLDKYLHSKYYLNSIDNEILLSAEERAFIDSLNQNHIVFKAVMKPDRLPLSGYKNNSPVGIIYEYTKEIFKRAGISVDLVNVNYAKDYNSVLKDSSIDIQLDYHSDLYTAEKSGFKKSSPYMNINTAAIALKKTTEYKTIAAVFDSDITQNYILKKYPADNITFYETNEECVNAVLKGKQDITFQTSFFAERSVYNDELNKLSYHSIPEYVSRASIAIKTSIDPRLYSIIDKAILSVDQTIQDSIITANSVNSLKTKSWKALIFEYPILMVIFLVFIIAVLVALFFVWFFYKKKVLVEQRDYEYFRYIAYISRVNDEVLEFNFSTQKKYRYLLNNNKVEVKEETCIDFLSYFIKDLHPNDIKSIPILNSLEKLEQLITSNDRINFECRKEIDGNYRWQQISLQGVYHERLNDHGLMCYRKDIDELKKDEARKHIALQEALAVAENASSAKGFFMSKMSHEIRTPLNAIFGYISIAETALNNPEKLKSCFAKTNIAVKHLLSIINDILDMSSIENGKIKITHSLFDLNQLISSISLLFYNQARDHRIHFETIVNNLTNENVYGDSMRLKQILINLLSNAIKFTPEEGSIEFSVSQIRKQKSKIYYQFKISDTGIGMSPEFLKKIWNPFEQADASISEKFGGSGLGLSITHNLVELMHGTIQVQSELGKESTFIVDIPFDEAEEMNTDESNGPPFGNLRALVVDDEPATCEYLNLILKRCHIECDYFYSGKAAINKLNEEKKHYDFLLVDWQMPEMDGLETAKSIRSILQKDVSCIIISAYDYAEIAERAKSLGMNHFISKPIFQSSLFNLLVSIFGKRNSIVLKSVESEKTFIGCKILLAEDNEMNREIAVEILKNKGFSVTTANNGKEVVDIFTQSEEGSFQAILMDVQMPIIDGYSATRLIRKSAHPEAKTIPILALSANAFSEDVAKSLAAGMNDHISKPIDLVQLYSSLSKHIKTDKNK